MKNVLITGGSRGIGRAIAKALVDQDYRFIINYRERRDMADSIVEFLRSHHRDAMAIQADLRDIHQVDAMFDKIEASYGTVDILISNAGIGNIKLFTDIDHEEWLDIMNVNVHGMYRCCRRAVPPMISKKAGQIITISSIWGMVGASCEVHYSTTKGAVIAFTKSLAKELAPSNIRVNCVAPGAIYTDMAKAAGEDIAQIVAEMAPLGRIGRVEEVAETVKFLLSQGGEYMTGQVVSPNGGIVI